MARKSKPFRYRKLTPSRVNYIFNASIETAQKAESYLNIYGHSLGFDNSIAYDSDSIRTLKMRYKSGERSTELLQSIRQLQKSVKGISPIKNERREQQELSKIADVVKDKYIRDVVGNPNTAIPMGKDFYKKAKEIFKNMSDEQVLEYLSKDKFGASRPPKGFFQKSYQKEKYNFSDDTFFQGKGGNYILKQLEDYYIRNNGVLPY